MKIIKLSTINTKKIKDTNYTVFKIKLKHKTKTEFLYNIIRRLLISKIMKPKVTNLTLYLFKQKKLYELINEHIKIEEIKESVKDIYTNIKKLKIRKKPNTIFVKNETTSIAIIKNYGIKKFKAKSLKTSNNIEIMNKEKHLFTIL